MLVVSSATVEAAGVTIPGAEIRDIALRGRADTLAVHIARDRAAVEAIAPAMQRTPRQYAPSSTPFKH